MREVLLSTGPTPSSFFYHLIFFLSVITKFCSLPFFSSSHVISRWGVAGAVLQTPILNPDFLKANYFARPKFMLETFAQVKGHKKPEKF